MEKIIIPVEIIALLEESGLKTPMIVLHSRQRNKVLPIFIGLQEAKAISIILQNVKTERPLTHELLFNVVKAMKGKLSKIVVDKIEGTVYCAIIHITTENEKIEIDARPSDAIALALRARVPIFVNKQLMEKSGYENPFEEPMSKKTAQKKEFTGEDIKKIQKLLKEAQKREQGNQE